MGPSTAPEPGSGPIGTSTAAGGTRRPLWLAGLFVAMLAIGTDEFVIAGVLPQISTDLDVSPAATGQLITVFAVTFALGAPLLALVTDRFARRAVIVAALVVFAVANAAAALAPDYWPLFAARMLAAAAAALVATTSFALAAAGAPQGRQGSYLSVVAAGLTVALFTGVPVGTWLGGAYGWRATFWLLAGIGTVVAVVLALSAPAVPGGPPAPLAVRLAPLRSGPVARLVGATFLCGSGGLMFYSYLGPLTAALANDSYQTLSLILLLVGVVGVAAVLLGGRLADSRGPRPARLIVIGGHAGALGALAVFAATGMRSIVVFAVLVAVWSIFAWALNPPLQASMLAAAPDAPATALALNITGLYLGTGVAGALGGLVLATAGVAYIPLAGAALLLAALTFAAGRTGTPTAHADTAPPSRPQQESPEDLCR